MGSWFIGGPSGPLRASAAPGARRRLRQVAGAVSLLLAVETAMVAESTGQAMAETPSGGFLGVGVLGGVGAAWRRLTRHLRC